MKTCSGVLAAIDWRSIYPNLDRFYNKLMERPAFADTAPKV